MSFALLLVYVKREQFLRHDRKPKTNVVQRIIKITLRTHTRSLKHKKLRQIQLEFRFDSSAK